MTTPTLAPVAPPAVRPAQIHHVVNHDAPHPDSWRLTGTEAGRLLAAAVGTALLFSNDPPEAYAILDAAGDHPAAVALRANLSRAGHAPTTAEVLP